MKNGKAALKGTCPQCGGKVFRIGGGRSPGIPPRSQGPRRTAGALPYPCRMTRNGGQRGPRRRAHPLVGLSGRTIRVDPRPLRGPRPIPTSDLTIHRSRPAPGPARISPRRSAS
jgi:hypothetical protein